jgi:capsular exopolysaccharide synthesis family protein
MLQSYETLMIGLQLRKSSGPLTSILVTSTQPEEGKTTVSVNLAITMTFSGKKVVLIDADLRKPRLQQIFQLNNTVGFSDVVSSRIGFHDAIQMVTSSGNDPGGRRGLSVVTSGGTTANALGLMDAGNLRERIEQLAKEFDMVIIDSPPVLSVSDPLMIAPIVDGVILVLNTGVVMERDAQCAKQRLEQAGARLLGVVMNRFSEKRHGPGYHPYQGYYYRDVRSRYSREDEIPTTPQ